MAEWTEARRGTFLAHVASAAGYDLSIIGGEGAWFWLVSRQGDDDALAEGEEPDLATAKEIVEDAVPGLAGDPGAT
jgi:hypothetical protein